MNKQFSLWRVLVVTLVILILLAGLAWQRGLIPQVRRYHSANSIMVLMPYRHAGTWVFDDPVVGLRREPFVSGIPEMMDELVKDIPDAEHGFRMLFSAQPFPGHTHHLVWRRGDESGNWYYNEAFNKEGWLCPGLFKYYTEAPKDIYIKAEKK
jgi:hypothetical protein